MKITIELDDEEVKILNKRANENLLSLKEQIEDIIRRSCITFTKNKTPKFKIDDRLVGIFSREKKGRPRKK